MANLLFLCDTFLPNVGGSERMLADMALGAVENGHSVTVFTPGSQMHPEDEKAFDQAQPYTVLRSARWKKYYDAGGGKSAAGSRISRLAILFYTFWKSIGIKNVDAIIVGHVLPLGNVAAALKKMKHIPVILITHGEDVSMYSRGPRMKKMLRSALLEADAIRCYTRDSALEITEIAPEVRDRIHVCAPEATLPPLEEVLDAPDKWTQILARFGKRYLLTIGRLVPRKGIDTTLKALAILKEEYPDLAYVIVGDGPYRPHLESLAKELGVDQRVLFVGENTQDAPFFYHACDVFVMPNRTMPNGEREGYGIVFVEAGLAGKPVIGGRSGGAVDAISDGVNGILVDPTDPISVIQAVRKLLKDPELAERMGKAGRERALRLSSPQAVRASFEEMLQSVLR